MLDFAERQRERTGFLGQVIRERPFEIDIVFERPGGEYVKSPVLGEHVGAGQYQAGAIVDLY